MGLKKKIFKNLSLIGVGEAISSVFSLLLVVLITRSLGAEGLGVYSFAFAFTGLFIMFYDFGVSTLFIKDVASDVSGVQKKFVHYASLKLVFCLIAMLLPIVTILFLKRTHEVNLIVCLAALSVFFQNYSYVPRNVFQALQEMKYDAQVRIAERMLAFFIGSYMLLQGYGLVAFMIVLVISNAVSLIYAAYMLRKVRVLWEFSIDVKAWHNMLKISWPFWLSAVFVQVYFYADTVMLSFMEGYDVAGIYNAAYKLIGVLSKMPMLIVLVLFPVMSELYAKLSKSLLKQALDKAMRVLIILSIPLMIGTVLISERLIQFVYREGFAESSAVLSILIWTTLFTFLSYMLGWFLNATNNHKKVAFVTGACLILNIILNFLLIPPFSYIGASVATLTTAVVNLALFAHFTSGAGYTTSIIRMSIRPFIAALVMCMFIVWKGATIHILLLVPFSAALYFVVLFLSGEVSKDDLRGLI